MSTTIPALSSVTDILDTDLVMVTHSNGESFKIAGSEINKRNQAVIASSTTVTGAPLKTGNIVRVYFTADITGSNTSTGLTLNYNGVNKSVKVPKNGTLVNFVASDLGGSPTVYKYLQAHTTLELLYDGTQFIIIGNPVVLSSTDYTIYADGIKRQNSIDSSINFPTCNAVRDRISSLNYTGNYVTKTQTVTGTGDWQISCNYPSLIAGTYMLSVWRDKEVSTNYQSTETTIGTLSFSNNLAQTIITTGSNGSFRLAIKGTSGTSYTHSIKLERL